VSLTWYLVMLLPICPFLLPFCLSVDLQYGQSHFFKLPGGKLKPDEDGEELLLFKQCLSCPSLMA
jgi:hypothetical protein